jgi:hypothetical protein
MIQGKTVIPTSASAIGTVVEAQPRGKFKGEGKLTLALKSIVIKGSEYPIQTETWGTSQKGKGKRTAGAVGGGAAGGALIGGLAGGGKGAAIGAIVGAGAGTAAAGLTGNKDIELPAESSLTFKLTSPLTIKQN